MEKKMKLRIDGYGKVIIVNDVEISFFILETIINTNDRVLYRFGRDGETLTMRALTEKQVVWLDESDLTPEK